MIRAVVIEPAEPVMTWDEVRHHVRLEADDERQGYVMSLVAAAQGHIDGPDGWLERSIGVQTLEARLDNFDCGSIRLPYPPAIRIGSVAYVDAAGDEKIVEPDTYELIGASLVSAFGSAWPATRLQRGGVRIQYVAGYEDVPPAIKLAVALMVQGLFVGKSLDDALKGAAEALLRPFQVYA